MPILRSVVCTFHQPDKQCALHVPIIAFMSRRLIESLSTNRTVQVKEAGIRVPMAVISGYVRASCHTAHRHACTHARVRAYKPLSALRVTFADMQLEPARKRKERGTYFESGNCRRACICRTYHMSRSTQSQSCETSFLFLSLFVAMTQN